MAVLASDEFSLEIRYRDFDCGWVVYDIWPRWHGEPVLNDAILKRHNEYWGKRGYGAIHANEHRGCAVLPVLRHVLETNEPDYCETTDPDILLAIYPKSFFPFLPSKSRVIWEAPHLVEARAQREAKRDSLGRLPDDLIELILFVDTYNFAGCSAYSGQGLCFRMSPRRATLEAFYQELRAEYITFKGLHGVDSFNEEDLRPDHHKEWF